MTAEESAIHTPIVDLTLTIDTLANSLPWWTELEESKITPDLADKIITHGNSAVRELRELQRLFSHITQTETHA